MVLAKLLNAVSFVRCAAAAFEASTAFYEDVLHDLTCGELKSLPVQDDLIN